MTTAPEAMRDHWYWRPGGDVGRRFYTWHLTFDGQADIRRFAAAYRTVLEPAGGLDLVPDRWLHLTMQGIGFVGEVDEQVALLADRDERYVSLMVNAGAGDGRCTSSTGRGGTRTSGTASRHRLRRSSRR